MSVRRHDAEWIAVPDGSQLAGGDDETRPRRSGIDILCLGAPRDGDTGADQRESDVIILQIQIAKDISQMSRLQPPIAFVGHRLAHGHRSA